MSNVKITDVEEVDLLYFEELPEKIQEERKDDYSDVNESTFFLYRDYYYDLNNFMRLENNYPDEFKGYHGYSNDTFFSGVLVKIHDGEEFITVARYYS